MDGFIEKIRSFVIRLEDTPVTLFQWGSGFLGVLLVRFFLEGWSSRNASGFLASDLSTNLHYVLFYLGTTLALALVLAVFTRVSSQKTLTLVLLGFPLIWVAPVCDLLLTGGASMGYLFEGGRVVASDFLTFFGPLLPQGVTLGMRIEFAVMLAAIGGYLLLRTRSWIWAMMGTLAAYGVIFLSVIFPSVPFLFSEGGEVLARWVYALYDSLLATASFHPAEVYEPLRAFELLFNGAMTQMWYVLVVLLGALYFRANTPRVFLATLKNIRPTRLMHYAAMFVGGALFAAFGPASSHAWELIDIVTLMVGLLSLAFAWTFSVATNDLVDEPIDRISDPSRPLVSGSLSREEMRNVAGLSGSMALIGALALGSYSTYFIGIYLGLYYVYSMPPLRLKRVPLIAPFLIALAHLVSAMLGFFLVSDGRMLSDFPQSLALLLVIGFTLAVNAKDLKDTAGDRAGGIMTIPVLLGERWGRVVVGGMLFLGFVLIPFLLHVPAFLLPCLLAGTIVWIGVVRGAGERFIVCVNIVNVLVLTAIYFFGR